MKYTFGVKECFHVLSFVEYKWACPFYIDDEGTQMKNVRIIPAIPKDNKKLKVAAYCRVSTLGPAQLYSLELQIKSYLESQRIKTVTGKEHWIQQRSRKCSRMRNIRAIPYCKRPIPKIL